MVARFRASALVTVVTVGARHRAEPPARDGDQRAEQHPALLTLHHLPGTRVPPHPGHARIALCRFFCRRRPRSSNPSRVGLAEISGVRERTVLGVSAFGVASDRLSRGGCNETLGPAKSVLDAIVGGGKVVGSGSMQSQVGPAHPHSWHFKPSSSSSSIPYLPKPSRSPKVNGREESVGCGRSSGFTTTSTVSVVKFWAYPSALVGVSTAQGPALSQPAAVGDPRTGEYARNMERACPRHTRLWSSRPLFLDALSAFRARVGSIALTV